MSNETGLEKAATKTPAIITTPEEYRGAVLRWQQLNYHILTPFTNVSTIAPNHGLISSTVDLSPNPADGDVYEGLPFLGRDEVAPAKGGLSKIEEALGVSHRLEYINVGTIQFYWHVKAIGTYRSLDGSIISREASQEWDLREGSPRLKGWKPNQIDEGRKYGLRNCETRAINAMLRLCGCGVAQKYSKRDLQKSFVAVRVMFIPDMQDPEIRRLVTERALGATTTMYPSAPRELGAGIPVDEQDDDRPRHVGRGSTNGAVAPAGTEQPGASDPNKPPIEGAVKIAKADPKAFTYKSGSRKGTEGTKYVIVDSNGVEYSTFEKSHYDDAVKFKLESAWVEIATETDGGYTNIIEITRAGSEPKLPGIGEL